MIDPRTSHLYPCAQLLGLQAYVKVINVLLSRSSYSWPLATDGQTSPWVEESTTIVPVYQVPCISHADPHRAVIIWSLYARKRLRLRLQVNTSTDPHCLSLLGRADTLNSSKAPWSAELCSPWRWKRCRQSCPYGHPPLPRTYVFKWDKSCLLLRQLNRISLFYIAELALSPSRCLILTFAWPFFFPHTPHPTPQHVSVPPPRLTVPAVALGFWVCLMWCLPLEDETSCWFILTSKGFIWPGSNYTSSGAVLCQGLVCRCLYYTFAVMFVLQLVQWWRTKKKKISCIKLMLRSWIFFILTMPCRCFIIYI